VSRQFDIVANPDAEDAALRPYLVLLQSDLVSNLRSVVVAPLVAREAFTGAKRLNPLVRVEGREFWLATHELFAIDRRLIGRTVGNLDSERDAVIAALDLLFTGF
jgi:toxin CcdB